MTGNEPVSLLDQRLGLCDAAIAAMGCSDLVDGDMPTSCRDLTDPLPTDVPPDGDVSTGTGVHEVSWQLYASFTQLTCSDLATETIRAVFTTPGGETTRREFPCNLGSALTTLPIGPYSVYLQAVTASGSVVEQSAASTVVVHPEGSLSTHTLSVSRQLGEYCATLAEAICNACDPSSSTCKSESYAGCCASDGTCGRPAFANPQRFPACIAGFESGAHCTEAPASCAGSVMVW